jgi:hypothetical protein
MVKEALLVAISLFLALLLFRFVRAILLGRRISREQACRPSEGDSEEFDRLLEEARAGGSRAREALRKLERNAGKGNAATRAAYHCAAGNLAVTDLKRPNLAVGFYLRALREDPTCVPAIDRLKEILFSQRRLRRFEKTCWEVLGRLDDDEVGSEMWVRCWSGLAAIYSASPRFVRRADAIRKLLESMGEEADTEPPDVPIEDADDATDAHDSLPRVGS